MADPPSFGSLNNPFWEAPHAGGWIKNVHWGGVKGVRWKAGALLSGDAVPSSPIGTLSMWIKFFDQENYFIVGGSGIDDSDGSMDITFQCGGGVDPLPDGGPFTVSVEAFFRADTILLPSNPGPGGGGGPGDVFFEFTRMVVFGDAGGIALNSTDNWHHVYMEWNAASGGMSLYVDGIHRGLHVWPGDIYLTPGNFDGPPATPNFSGGFAFFRNSDRSALDYPFAIADLWLDFNHVSVGVDKFIDTVTKRAKVLGEFGEKPLTPAPTPAVPNPTPVKPHFFLHRAKDDPLSFLENRGTAGAVSLSGAEPIIEDGQVKAV